MSASDVTAASVERWLGDYRALESRGFAGSPAWLAPLRREAIERFREGGLPTTKEEDWKYTSVEPIARTAWRAAAREAAAGAASAALARLDLGLGTASRLVFVDGRFSAELSSPPAGLPGGAHVGSLAEALRERRELVEPHLARVAGPETTAFAALNAAFLDDGALVHVPDGAALEEPLELVFLAGGGGEAIAAHPRVLVVLGRGARAMLAEIHGPAGGGASLANAVVEVVLAEDAVLHHVKVVAGGEAAAHVAATAVSQARGSRHRSTSIVLGGAFVRNDLRVRLGGEGAECSLDGLHVSSGTSFVDDHTAIEHASPGCTSEELYKGVLAGRSRAVFNGKVIVRPGAAKTDARQRSRSLLLSDRAEVDAKPELQIHADDVRCTHGAAIGQLDPAAVFYCRSRGMSEETARRTLTWGFAAEIVRRIEIPGVAESLEARLHDRLAGLGGGVP